jgi:phospholipase/lecithinase/hemolysin
MSLRALLALIVWLAPLPAARAQLDLSHTVAFGDSLTDNGGGGADPIESVLRKAAAAGPRSFAIAGTKSDVIRLQVLFYLWLVANNLVPPPTFVSLEGGANDLILDPDFASFPFGASAAVDAKAWLVLANLAAAAGELLTFFPHARLLVWTVPDVTLAPGAALVWNAAQRANVRTHIAFLNGAIRSVAAMPSIAVLDAESLWAANVASPPFLVKRALLPPPAFGMRDHLFADPIHPTAVFNAIHANAIIALINAKWGATIPAFTIAELAMLAGIGC